MVPGVTGVPGVAGGVPGAPPATCGAEELGVGGAALLTVCATSPGSLQSALRAQDGAWLPAVPVELTAAVPLLPLAEVGAGVGVGAGAAIACSKDTAQELQQKIKAHVFHYEQWREPVRAKGRCRPATADAGLPCWPAAGSGAATGPPGLPWRGPSSWCTRTGAPLQQGKAQAEQMHTQ